MLRDNISENLSKENSFLFEFPSITRHSGYMWHRPLSKSERRRESGTRPMAC